MTAFNKQTTDEDLMERYKLGDYLAFEILYNRHSGKIHSFLCKRIFNQTEIDDVFQKVFIKFHRTKEKYDQSLPLLPWLFTICRNEMISHLRSIQRIKEDSKDNIEDIANSNIQLVSNEPNRVDELDRVEEIPIDSLAEKDKNIIKLRYQDDLSFEEISNRLGITSTNARKILSRAIKKLKLLVEKVK